MSWFNPLAFAAGALGEVEKLMDRNEEEARKFEDEQRELSTQSRKEIARRRSIVDKLVSESKRLEALGVTKEQIMAAHASGPTGLMELSEQVTKEVARRGGIKRLSEYDISAMIDATAIDPKIAEMDYEEFISRSAGLLNTTAGDYATPKRSIGQRFLGTGAKDVVRAKLDREKTVGGYSIYDLNELAKSAAYTSAMPGSYATFSPGEFYDQEAALKSWSLAQRRIDTALQDDDVYQELIAKNKLEEALAYKRKRYAAFAQAQFNKYGSSAINDPVLDYKNILGEKLYVELATANDADEEIIRTIDTGAGAILGRNITKTGPNGGYTLHRGLGEGIAKITVVGPKGNEQTIEDSTLILEFINKLVKRGELSKELARATFNLYPPTGLSPEQFNEVQDLLGAVSNEASIETTGLGMAGELDINALTEAALGAAEAEPKVAETEEEPEKEEEDVQEEVFISAPSADKFTLKGVTYEEWKGMSRKERKEKGLPTSVIGGELGFKRFQKGLGINIAEEQPAAEFADMGKAQINIDSIDVDTVVTIDGKDYKVGESLGQKYFEKLDDETLPEETFKDIAGKSIKKFNDFFESGNYDTSSEDDLYEAFISFTYKENLPKEVERFIGDRLDLVAKAITGN